MFWSSENDIDHFTLETNMNNALEKFVVLKNDESESNWISSFWIRECILKDRLLHFLMISGETEVNYFA